MIFSNLPEGYISPEKALPSVDLGVGFQRKKALELDGEDLKMLL